jgi:hypothetical protein
MPLPFTTTSIGSCLMMVRFFPHGGSSPTPLTQSAMHVKPIPVEIRYALHTSLAAKAAEVLSFEIIDQFVRLAPEHQRTVEQFAIDQFYKEKSFRRYEPTKESKR